MRSFVAVTVFLLGVRCQPAIAALVVDSVNYSYSQDFDFDLSSPYNGDETWLNDFTLAGWSLFRVTSNSNPTPVPIVGYVVSNGSSGDGRFYTFGDMESLERALGGVGNGSFGSISPPEVSNVPPGAAVGWIAVSFMNNTGSILSQFTARYDGEQWRDAGNDEPVAQTMVFQYGFGATFGGVSMWHTPGASFDFTSPVFTTNQGALNGNAPANRTPNLGGTITGLNWQPGETLWVRYIEQNDNVVDHGLAIENFSLSLTSSAVPEPGAVVLVGAIFSLVVLSAFIGRANAAPRRTADKSTAPTLEKELSAVGTAGCGN